MDREINWNFNIFDSTLFQSYMYTYICISVLKIKVTVNLSSARYTQAAKVQDSHFSGLFSGNTK
jgi:hypothetical protein